MLDPAELLARRLGGPAQRREQVERLSVAARPVGEAAPAHQEHVLGERVEAAAGEPVRLAQELRQLAQAPGDGAHVDAVRGDGEAHVVVAFAGEGQRRVQGALRRVELVVPVLEVAPQSERAALQVPVAEPPGGGDHAVAVGDGGGEVADGEGQEGPPAGDRGGPLQAGPAQALADPERPRVEAERVLIRVGGGRLVARP